MKLDKNLTQFPDETTISINYTNTYNEKDVQISIPTNTIHLEDFQGVGIETGLVPQGTSLQSTENIDDSSDSQ